MRLNGRIRVFLGGGKGCYRRPFYGPFYGPFWCPFYGPFWCPFSALFKRYRNLPMGAILGGGIKGRWRILGG